MSRLTNIFLERQNSQSYIEFIKTDKTNKRIRYGELYQKAMRQLCLFRKNVVNRLRNPHIYIQKDYYECVKRNVKVSNSNEDDVAVIQFSSGSTGIPKGVSISYGNIIENNISCIHSLEVTSQDIAFSWLPYTHNFALLGGHIIPIIKDFNQYKMPTELFLMNPTLWLDLLTKTKTTITFTANFGLLHCIGQLEADVDYN